MTVLQRIENKIYPITTIILLLVVWQFVVVFWHIPKFILPSPIKVIQALMVNFPVILDHTEVTLLESVIGFNISILLAFLLSILMDNYPIIKKSIYPLMIVSQTVPTIAITPIIMIWFGFGMLPKVLLIVLVCFFPIAVSLVDGFEKVDREYMNLFKTMKANKLQTFLHLKLPYAMVHFFSGLKIAATYMVMTTIISEWQGGVKGIGVYMVRAKSAYALDQLFASILVIVIISLIFIYLVELCSKKVTHWKQRGV
ncbi:ABC transporter permease [Bacillus sp. 03113]|uniref:ABC transporter permease n=1 Tax=Bacillus sp. 03113 TaxID=2578211 RepID=UPI001144846C|nr:ABC transporter permease [Bacillus sp. 03113]